MLLNAGIFSPCLFFGRPNGRDPAQTRARQRKRGPSSCYPVYSLAVFCLLLTVSRGLDVSRVLDVYGNCAYSTKLLLVSICAAGPNRLSNTTYHHVIGNRDVWNRDNNRDTEYCKSLFFVAQWPNNNIVKFYCNPIFSSFPSPLYLVQSAVDKKLLPDSGLNISANCRKRARATRNTQHAANSYVVVSKSEYYIPIRIVIGGYRYLQQRQ